MNINEKKQKNAEIQQILQKIMLISKTGFCKYNATNKAYFFCDNILSWFSQREQETVQEKGLLGLLPLGRPKEINKKIMHAFAHKKEKVEFVEHIGLDKKGVCIFEVNLDLSYGTDGKPAGILIIVHDITSQEKARILLLNQKNIADKHAAFRANQIANMSHEIRTPIGGILGIADVLLSESHSENTKEKLNVIKQSAEIMMKTLTLTLDHCKIMASGINLKPNPVSPRQLLASISLLWQGQASKNNTKILYSYSAGLPGLISIDEFRIKQCLNNLLSNSVKFTKNGQINIIMKAINKPERKPQLVIIVQDTGIGITEQQQKRIFKRYEQADDNIADRFGGTGLGMSIIQEIIRTMNGRIIVKSKKGIGTTIGLVLPLKCSTSIALIPTEKSTCNVSYINAMKATKQKQDKRANLLVVDDILTNRLVLEYILRDEFSNLVFAENGQEAINILNDQNIDLILMDIHMPVLNGVEATKSIRASSQPYKDIPIIAVTADAEYHKRVTRRTAGFDDVIEKPVNKQVLLDAVEQGLAKPRWREGNVKPLFAK